MAIPNRGRLSVVLVVAGCALFVAACGGRTGVLGNASDPEPDPGCNNGILEPALGEQCDGDNVGGWSCAALGFAGGTLRCDGHCRFETSQCTSPATCGNGLLDDGEECDGNLLDRQSCESLGWVGGTLSCAAECQFDTAYCHSADGCGDGEVDPGEECDDYNRAACDGCSPMCQLEVCGNGVVDCGEECDDGNLQDGDGCNGACRAEFVCGDGWCEDGAGETCALCPVDCCPSCGNGAIDDAEECDGADLGGLSCESLCYDGGALACRADCQLDTSGCQGGPVCGDGVAECDEQCDQSDLGGRSCQDFGFSSGTLSCNMATCTLDTSGCTGFLWYFHDDFEEVSTVSRWTLGGDWEWGTPTGQAGEPTAPYEGLQCLGTGMGHFYANDRTWEGNMAVTPPIDLTAAQAPVLTYAMWLKTEECCDGGAVWVRAAGDTTWSHLTNPSVSYTRQLWNDWAWAGQGLGFWQMVDFDLWAWAGQVVEIGFALFTDSSVTAPGFYVDDVLVTEAAVAPLTIVTDPELGAATVGNAWSHPLVATGGSGSYFWTKQPGGVNHGWLIVDPVSGELTGTPSAGNRGPVEVVIRVEEASNPGSFHERSFELTVVDSVWEESFDNGSSGWTLSGDWAWGVPSGSGPLGCRAGSCMGTVLGGNYHDDQTWGMCTATSPLIDLANTTAPILQFWAYVDSEGGSFDGGNLKISTGGPAFSVVTDVLPAYNLTNVAGQWAWGGANMTPGWQRFEADLSAYAGQSILIQFGFRSDGAVTRAGFYVDELTILD